MGKTRIYRLIARVTFGAWVALMVGCGKKAGSSPQMPAAPGVSLPSAGSGDAAAAVTSTAGGLVQALRGGRDFMIGLDNQSGDGFSAQGIKIDLFYAYLSSGWTGWNPNGTYVDVVAGDADREGATPMFTVYQLALALENGNFGIFTAPDLHQYLLDMRLMYQRLAVFDKPAVVHFEPDFFGYLRQYLQSHQTTPDDVAATLHFADFHDCDGDAETVKGLLSCLVRMGRAIAPKVKIGFATSSWGDWFNDTDPSVDVAAYGAKTADFMRSVGADATDLVVVETLDRDAGFWEAQGGHGAVYWDATNQALPNFKQHFTWVKALTAGLGKPAVWWQTPLGVPGDQPGSAGHWRDNRVSYFFSHVDELVAAGGAGMAFGAGAAGQSTIQTDGGQFKAAAAAYRAKPVALPGPPL